MSLDKLSLRHPLLSIIVPVYKVEQWLPACIESVLRQTYQNWELILIDDGSPDGCGAICDTYAAKDARIHAIHQVNSGVSIARNVGLDKAHGQYITFLDSDDELEDINTLFSNMVILQNDQSIDVLQYPFRYSNESNYRQHLVSSLVDKPLMYKAILNGSISGFLWAKIFKRELFKSIRLPEKMALAEDIYCLLDIVELVDKFYLSSKGCYKYTVRQDSAIYTFNKDKCLDMFKNTHKFIKLLGKYLQPNDEALEKYFFYAFQCLLNARIAQKNQFPYKEYQCELKFFIPVFRSVFDSNLSIKNKIWLVLLKIFGLNVASDMYVNFVLWRCRKQ